MTEAILENIEWIKSGKIGCTFASYFARVPGSIGWIFIESPDFFYVPEDCLMLSLVFPNKDKHYVRQWALNNGFWLEEVESGFTGLRYTFTDGVSWVQYFGKDTDVKTRQTPHPMLTMSVRLPAITYFKVGVKGVLHIAHASVKNLSKLVADRLWDTSHSNTERQLGHKPTIKEAAKTTFHE